MADNLLDQLLEFFSETELFDRGSRFVSSRYRLWDRMVSGEDVAQDVLLKFKTRSPLKDASDAKKVFSYYLASLDQRAEQCLNRVLRNPDKRRELEDELIPGDEPDGLETALRSEARRNASKEVARLYEIATDDETAVLDRLMAGLSTGEIAEQLGVSDSAVRMRLHFLRKRSRRVHRKPGRKKARKEPERIFLLISLHDGAVLIAAAA